jgi:hypothetical protein
MEFPGLLINSPEVYAKFHGLAIVALNRRKKNDATVTMPMVVPIQKELKPTSKPGACW